ncbi:MAG: 5-dehydro-2-deoxygluconokinase [Chloroflexota bacterium]
MSNHQYDLLTIGRCSLDLFSQQIGAAFVDIESFSTQVGGSPTNIAIGTSRLGLHSAAVTAVGADPVGGFVRSYLSRQGVATEFVWEKNGRTSLAVVGIEPPDRFPLVFYRDNPPDHAININDIKTLPLAETKMLLVAGSNFAAPDLSNASRYAAQQTSGSVIIDLDLRPTLWVQPEAYPLSIQTVWPHCDVVIGTEEEVWAALSEEPSLVWGSALPTERQSDLLDLIAQHQTAQQMIVLKRGASGVTLFLANGEQVDVAGFPVEVLNTVGAGDAFASGLLYGCQQSWSWAEAARFANACGAIVVTRHGCSAAMATLNEVVEFIENHS